MRHRAHDCPRCHGWALHVPMHLLTDRFRERFGLQVESDAAGCWYWRDQRDRYTHMPWLHQNGIAVHRVAYALATGEDVCPVRQVIHHTCLNKACVNPAHLEAMWRGRHAQLHQDLLAELRAASPDRADLPAYVDPRATASSCRTSGDEA